MKLFVWSCRHVDIQTCKNIQIFIKVADEAASATTFSWSWDHFLSSGFLLLFLLPPLAYPCVVSAANCGFPNSFGSCGTSSNFGSQISILGKSSFFNFPIWLPNFSSYTTASCSSFVVLGLVPSYKQKGVSRFQIGRFNFLKKKTKKKKKRIILIWLTSYWKLYY